MSEQPQHHSTQERLALVESRLGIVDTRLTYLSEKIQFAQDNQQKILDTLHQIKYQNEELIRDITKYKGFIGGMALVFTGVGAVLVFFKGWFLSKMGIPQ